VLGFGFPLALHIPTDRQTNKQTSSHPFILAEVPGAARVNLQPAEHLKNASFSFRVSGPPGSDRGGGRGQTCTKTFLRQIGM